MPGPDLPGLDIASVSRGLGCHAVDVASAGDLEKQLEIALESGTTTVIVVTIRPEKAMLRHACLPRGLPSWLPREHPPVFPWHRIHRA
ncbi:hypothetical protein [Nocardia sp. NPDC049707]|uniref:hypothetical protein n=1 Tax=Nocardia sp. NPDC049707 TaxID=3154735 RepID=UPI003429C5B0